MSGENYYLVTSLPALPELGEPAPMDPGQLLRHVETVPAARELVATVLLQDDLLQREALAAGEIETPEPSVLSAEQLRGEAPLPDWLSEPVRAGEADSARRLTVDAAWASYFRHAMAVARRRRCAFLREWVRREVSLRNALARRRAAALGLEPSDYLVAEDIAAGEDPDLESILNEWSAAADPLGAQRTLDRARWAWLESHDAWFTFHDDELAAYAAKLMLIVRWERIAAAEAAAE